MSPSRGAFLLAVSLVFVLLSWRCRADNHDPHKQCYVPSGGVSFGTPCHPDQDVSFCCGFGWTCLSNGLCKPTSNNLADYRSKVFRNSCTDHTWSSPNCTQFCRGPEDNLDGQQGVRTCDEEAGTYCCQRSFDCCKNSSLLLHLGPGTPLLTVARPTSLAAAATDEDRVKPPVARETVVGVAGGFSIAAGLFVIAWAVILVRRHRRLRLAQGKKDDEKGLHQANELDAIETMVETDHPPRPSSYMAPGDSSNPAELESTNTRSELDTLPSRSATSRTFTENTTLSPISPESPEIGTLVTPDILEMEAPYKRSNTPNRPG